ncbi:hypothetical protein GCM10007377_01460 [Galliscardovia ingluviei]|uniref:Uncharacterized protein n=1 Tax=Galliscardovia ingluviei TaxID=1769422 RepID=A0A8J3ADZ0_9BIFI|nr:hypothetical protein [Galliscardovia ingluviei]GGI12538.1 hypothetical protein GCM10007377_01460 [Galliscardovia ingluviei]
MLNTDENSPESKQDDPWEVTSLKMRRSTKRAIKVYAAEHDETMQNILEQALTNLLTEKNRKYMQE